MLTKVFLIYMAANAVGVNPTIIDMDHFITYPGSRMQICERLIETMTKMVKPRGLYATCVEMAE